MSLPHYSRSGSKCAAPEGCVTASWRLLPRGETNQAKTWP